MFYDGGRDMLRDQLCGDASILAAPRPPFLLTKKAAAPPPMTTTTTTTMMMRVAMGMMVAALATFYLVFSF